MTCEGSAGWLLAGAPVAVLFRLYRFVPVRAVRERDGCKELELSPWHGSDLVSVEYSLELAHKNV